MNFVDVFNWKTLMFWIWSTFNHQLAWWYWLIIYEVRWWYGVVCSVWYDGGGGSQWVIQKIRVTNRLNVYSIEVNVKFSESIEFGLIQVEDSCQVNWIKWDIMTVSMRICECEYIIWMDQVNIKWIIKIILFLL